MTSASDVIGRAPPGSVGPSPAISIGVRVRRTHADVGHRVHRRCQRLATRAVVLWAATRRHRRTIAGERRAGEPEEQEGDDPASSAARRLRVDGLGAPPVASRNPRPGCSAGCPAARPVCGRSTARRRRPRLLRAARPGRRPSVLLRGHLGVVLGAGRRHGPGVGSNGTQPRPSNQTSGHAWAFLPSTEYVPLADVVAGREPDRDPGRDPERAHHRRIRAGELLAVADAVAQEHLDRVVAVAGLHLEAVARTRRSRNQFWRAAPLVGECRPGGHLECRLADRRREVVGQLEVDRVAGVGRGRRVQRRHVERRRRRDDVEDVAGVELARRSSAASTCRRSSAGPSCGEPRSGRRPRDERAAEVDDPDLVGEARWRRPGGRELAVGRSTARARAAPRSSRRTRGSADDRQYDSTVACTTNSSMFERLVRRDRMSTSGLTTSVTLPPRRRGSRRAVRRPPRAAAGRRSRRDRDDERAVPIAAGTTMRTGTRATDRSRPVRRVVGAKHDGGEDAGRDEEHRQRDPDAVGAERGDEDEQHAAGHERLGAGEGAERERVGEHDRSRIPIAASTSHPPP